MLEVGAAKFATRHHVRDDVISGGLSPSEHLRYELKQSFELVIAFKSEAGERRFPAP